MRWGYGSTGYTLFQTVVPPNSKQWAVEYLRGPVRRAAILMLRHSSNAQSNHPGGVNVLFADGSVRFIKDSISLRRRWLSARGPAARSSRPTLFDPLPSFSSPHRQKIDGARRSIHFVRASFGVQVARSMRRLLLIVVIGLGIAATSWFAAMAVADWQLRSQLRAAQREITARRLDEARTRLTRLAERWPGRGDVAFWMGACEMILHHDNAALEAWGRVPPQASEAPLAALSRGRLAFEVGRYRLAETCLQSAIPAGGDIGEEAWRLLGWLYWITGRRNQYASVLRRDVDRARDPTRSCATSGVSTSIPIRSRGSNKRSRRPDDRPRTTTGSGLPWPIWRPAPGISTRPASGSRGASRLGPTIAPSGMPGLTGPRPPIGPMRSCVRRTICPCQA